MESYWYKREPRSHSTGLRKKSLGAAFTTNTTITARMYGVRMLHYVFIILLIFVINNVLFDIDQAIQKVVNIRVLSSLHSWLNVFFFIQRLEQIIE